MSSRISQQIDAISQWFLKSNKTLALAESCTGGLVSSFITQKPGASAYFLGSVVSYAGSVKHKTLGVPLRLIKAHGEVSLPVALSMARGARAQMGSDWTISITGVAGPTGGTPDKPVGTVCFAVVGPGFEEVKRVLFKSKKRQQIQLESAEFALEFLWKSITGAGFSR